MRTGRLRAPLVLLTTSVAVLAATFTAALDNTVVAVALRDIQRDLGSGVTGLQGVVTAYTVTMAALLLAGGSLVDAVGAKRVLLAGTLIFGAASAACATSHSVTALVASRAVQGVGAALLLPGGLALLAAVHPDGPRRRRALGVWAATGGAALVAGPVVGGELVSRHGWPTVFWVNVPLCALVVVLLAGAPRALPGRRAGFDLAGAALACLTLGAATYAVVLAGRHGLSWRVGAALAVAAGAGWALRAAAGRHPAPLLPLALLRDRRWRGALLGSFAAALAVFVLLVFLSLFLQLVQDRDAQEAGRVLLPLPVALVVVAPLAGRWRAVRGPVTGGLALAGLALLCLGLRLRAGTGREEMEAWLAVVGAGVGLTSAPLASTALAAATEARAGLAAAGVNAARELGGVVAVAGLGALAVARLAHRLSSTLVTAGVAHDRRPAMLDALLGARTRDARRMLVQDLGVQRALQVAEGLTGTATASFVGSTRLVLQAGGAVLLVAALACARALRP